MFALTAVSASHWIVSPDQVLHATTTNIVDSDADGLPDTQELVLGTSPYLVDSDGDGASDAMELALGTSPVLSAQMPTPGKEMGVGMVARGGGGMTTIQVLMYSSTASFEELSLVMSVKTSAGIAQIDMARLEQFSTASDSVLPGGAGVRSVAIELSPRMVQAPGEIHWVAAIGHVSASQYASAATCVLSGSADENSVYWSRSGHTLPPNHSGRVPTAGDQISQPIPPDPHDSQNNPGTPGMVCLQSSQVVGTGPGSTIITEIIAADCQTGWAAFCDLGACQATVGTTFESVNPRSLLGG
ncbi:MAG: thrombospondin type 3 repeat-containing protein [Planctomycetota bacterium]|nr:thrombospondin type 3 repeat-containing protein [Planctomycetota bacterium]